eukprot:557009-Rhodomonas_salina.2
MEGRRVEGRDGGRERGRGREGREERGGREEREGREEGSTGQQERGEWAATLRATNLFSFFLSFSSSSSSAFRAAASFSRCSRVRAASLA